MAGLRYERPQIVATRTILPKHAAELTANAIDLATAGLAGVASSTHKEAHDLGIRGDHALDGICFRYWVPWDRRFSRRFVRIKPDLAVPNRKYLQPVGEKPTLYFIAGTTEGDLSNVSLPILLAEGEKKALALDRAIRQLSIPGLTIGIGGVWSWRWSPRELQPDGKLGKGKSTPISDLDRINWASRTVYLLFDSDVSTNWKVAAAETALAKELTRRGATVRIVRIPGGVACQRSA